MFLKNLTMKGFKSFASTTSLDLEPGVTVVVGPNGSGKSNVVDAIAWVLGAQSPKAVRSQKMDDVIFAGTQSKAALGRAEVSLTIDNSARLLPIEFEEVTISRTLFRTGESEYHINGVACRLLDIQELLSDSGVGRQQHVIVSQGQIDAVLNARPEDRRAIIEEAAGVLKYRRRKDKSQRRLDATEANLTRLQDLLREVRRQLKPLERQADAARRHGDLLQEFTQLRTHVLGNEIKDLRERLRESATQQANFGETQRNLTASLRELDVEVGRAESQLAAAGVNDLSDVLIRCESLRERLRGLDGVLSERLRALARERDSSVDGAVRSTLENDLEQIRRELADVEVRATELAGESGAVEKAEAELAEVIAAFEDQWGDGVPSVSEETAQVRGELGARTSAQQQSRTERGRLASQLETLRVRIQGLDQKADQLRTTLAESEKRETELVDQLEAVERRELEARSRVDESKVAHEGVVDEHRRWVARAEALGLALEELRAGSAQLDDLSGVLGTLVEMVEVDAGWEDVFAAAVGDAAAAVVVADADAGRAALDALAAGDSAGLVLALGSAWPRRMLSNDGEALRPHVRGTRDGIDDLLDRLIGDVVVVDTMAEAIDLSLDNPEVSVVTRNGARFNPTGWRIGGSRQAVTGAALEEATSEAGRTELLVAELTQELDRHRNELKAVESERSRLQAQLNETDDAALAATEALSSVLRSSRDIEVEVEGVEARIAELDDRLGRDDSRVEELAVRLAALEADEAAQLEQGQLMDTERRRIDEQATAAAAMRADLEIRSSAIDEQREFLNGRSTDVTERLERHIEQEEATGQWTVEHRHEVVSGLKTLVAERTGIVDGWLSALRAQRQRQSEEIQGIAAGLDALRAKRTATDKSLTELRERAGRSEIHDAELNVRLESAIETLRRELDVEPKAAMETECPELADGVTAESRLRELEGELRIMGPVNPLALQEYEALSERFEFLTGQLEDVKSSRRDLNKVIKAIDVEIVNVFASAYADVAENFTALFSTLFPGGQGKLRLTDPSDMLNTGIEVEARPSGKNVRKLSLLSGGERSLTALAFLFGVFRSRPSPFYVMDEVEAALDDVNLHRFLELVAEFRDEAQLLIVSHQKRTMEAADCLYGISMKPGASSVAISEKSGADMSQYVEDSVRPDPDSVPEPATADG